MSYVVADLSDSLFRKKCVGIDVSLTWVIRWVVKCVGVWVNKSFHTGRTVRDVGSV